MFTIRHTGQVGSHQFEVKNQSGQICHVSIWSVSGALSDSLGAFGGEVWPVEFPELFTRQTPSAQAPTSFKLTPLAQRAFSTALSER